MKKFDVLVPIIKEDLQVFLYMLPFWERYLPIKNIVFVGPKSLESEVNKLGRSNCEYIDEDTIINFSELRNIIEDYTQGDEISIKRTGWYLQQFIKMQYSFLCKEEYYLIWDSDTMPLHAIEMIEGKTPIFHMKEEHNQPYFDTMSRLFGEDMLKSQKSFIAEHMLINCKVMKELINCIKSREDIQGNVWYEKVIKSIDKKDIMYSGFSEFETYGTYVMTYHPQLYRCKDWKSERGGHLYFEIENLDCDDVSWLGKQLDALSFEKTSNYDTIIKKILKYKFSHIISFTSYIRLLEKYNTMLSLIRRSKL